LQSEHYDLDVFFTLMNLVASDTPAPFTFALFWNAISACASLFHPELDFYQIPKHQDPFTYSMLALNLDEKFPLEVLPIVISNYL
jgi:hypothetical protein